MAQDNRIRFPATKIDFDADVGVTSQDHDNYPSPGGQARYDHMRIYLIGLLSQQSSFEEPTQKRDGTPWFDLNTFSLKIYINNEWVQYSNAIRLDGNTTLADWYSSASGVLASLSQDITFGGKCTVNDINEMAIPSQFINSIFSDSRAFVYVNGLLIDPREVQFVGSPATLLRFSTIILDANDEFFVHIKRIPNDTFLTSDITIP